MGKPRYVDLLDLSKILDTLSKKFPTFGQPSSYGARLDHFLLSRTNVTPKKCQPNISIHCEGDLLFLLDLDRIPDEIAGGNTMWGSISEAYIVSFIVVKLLLQRVHGNDYQCK